MSSSARQFPPETFIIVRPPPGLTQSANNLQLQLISPLTRPLQASPQPQANSSIAEAVVGTLAGFKNDLSTEAVAVASFSGSSIPLDRKESLELDASGNRSRSGSVRSVKSNRSGQSGGSKGSSFTSRRRCEPLYNLTFHSILPTVVTDAGTDEKISKWLKPRGIEITSFAILDPIDSSTSPSALTKSLPSAILETMSPPPMTPTVPVEPSGGFLSKFRRLSFRPTTPAGPSSPSPSSPSASKSTFGSLFRAEPSVSSFRTAGGNIIVPLFDEEGAEQALKSKGYTWIVRKWLRSDLSGSEGDSLKGQLQFEWRRGRKPAGSGARRAARQDRSGSTLMGVRSLNHLPPLMAASPRATKSFDVPRSPTTPTSSSLSTGKRVVSAAQLHAPDSRRNSYLSNSSHGGSTIDDTSNSSHAPSHTSSPPASPRIGSDRDQSLSEDDEEDLEAPWYCHVVYQPLPSRDSISSMAIPTSKKLLIGALTPAPYHPKLVAHLSVPYFTPFSINISENEGQEITLSVEELKDVFSITALWLVVRESLGGLDQQRKGDRKVKRVL